MGSTRVHYEFFALHILIKRMKLFVSGFGAMIGPPLGSSLSSLGNACENNFVTILGGLSPSTPPPPPPPA